MIKNKIVIDDITTTGNIFESCKQLLRDEEIGNSKIYCMAIRGTIRYGIS